MLWLVWYEGRAVATREPFRALRATVVATNVDEAYSEAAIELGEANELRFPIQAEPLIKKTG